MSGEHLGDWLQWLPLAEWWYNSTHHSTIHSSPYEALYGQPPPHHNPYFVDKHQSERQFNVGDLVYLRLQPYGQHSFKKRWNQKLSQSILDHFQWKLGREGSIQVAAPSWVKGKLILLMRRCELLLEMGQKVLTTQEAEREPLRQDNNALTFRTLKWIDMIACLHYSCPSSSTLFMSFKLDKLEPISFQLLNSPWDVCFDPVNEKVYIAMAGQHQIWEHSIQDGVTRAFSGNGYERNLNGSSSTNTSFAQPSGISLSPDLMEAYVADSESSSIRALDLKTGGSRLLAGGDPVFSENLFRFGDHDGVGSDVLLQHPLGVLCAKDGQIYIADSYNHKIKKLDPASKRVTTLGGTGKAGFKDGKALAAQVRTANNFLNHQGSLKQKMHDLVLEFSVKCSFPDLRLLEAIPFNTRTK
ncbi:NHL repeat-containing protein 2 [Gossypium australe]|uniref:NHL repeat-containing protein 2 n=1 Tax=Gossypium australe TaxID=47621 RepID=A0A5B6WYU8_9ROSI|nr:NHL repeat-containing protein 2 [Gossypium australe]